MKVTLYGGPHDGKIVRVNRLFAWHTHCGDRYRRITLSFEDGTTEQAWAHVSLDSDAVRDILLARRAEK